MGYDIKAYVATNQLTGGGVQTIDLVAPASGQKFIVKKMRSHILNAQTGGTASYTVELAYVPASGEKVSLFGPTAYAHGGTESEYRTHGYNDTAGLAAVLGDAYKNMKDVILESGDKIQIIVSVFTGSGTSGGLTVYSSIYGALKS